MYNPAGWRPRDSAVGAGAATVSDIGRDSLGVVGRAALGRPIRLPEPPAAPKTLPVMDQRCAAMPGLSHRRSAGMQATGPGSRKSEGPRISSTWLAWIVT